MIVALWLCIEHLANVKVWATEIKKKQKGSEFGMNKKRILSGTTTIKNIIIIYHFL